MLYIVSTPIGNLKDITLRALEVLKSVDLIACEDTRQSLKLFLHYEIKKPLVSYHSYSKVGRSKQLLRELKAGKDIALVSDSGTPGISDPGWLIIKQALDAGIKVISIPGANAAIAALSSSGLPTDKFFFAGFLSPKSGRRRRQLAEFNKLEATIVIYESPLRLLKLLGDILSVCGDLEIATCRELTKKFEEIRRESLSLSIGHFSRTKPRGEFVVIFRPQH